MRLTSNPPWLSGVTPSRSPSTSLHSDCSFKWTEKPNGASASIDPYGSSNKSKAVAGVDCCTDELATQMRVERQSFVDVLVLMAFNCHWHAILGDNGSGDFEHSRRPRFRLADFGQRLELLLPPPRHHDHANGRRAKSASSFGGLAIPSICNECSTAKFLGEFTCDVSNTPIETWMPPAPTLWQCFKKTRGSKRPDLGSGCCSHFRRIAQVQAVSPRRLRGGPSNNINRLDVFISVPAPSTRQWIRPSFRAASQVEPKAVLWEMDRIRFADQIPVILEHRYGGNEPCTEATSMSSTAGLVSSNQQHQPAVSFVMTEHRFNGR